MAGDSRLADAWKSSGTGGLAVVGLVGLAKATSMPVKLRRRALVINQHLCKLLKGRRRRG